MSRFSQHLLLSAAFTIAAASPALTQESIDTVTVSASRIALEGYSAPTPVMQINRDRI